MSKTVISKGGAKALRKEVQDVNPLGKRFEKEILKQFDDLHSQNIWGDKEIEEFLLKDKQAEVEAMGKYPDYPKDLVKFNPSGASSADMDLWLKAMGHKAVSDLYPYHKRWTRNSTAVHEAIQHDLIYSEKYTKGAFRMARMKNGLPAWEHNVLRWKEFDHRGVKFILHGMLDGIMIHNATGTRVGFEFKTKSNTIAQVGDFLMKGPYDYHVDQTVAYYLLTGVRDYLLVYEALAKPKWTANEDAKPDMRAFHVYITDEMANNLLDKWAYVAQKVYDKELPDNQELGFFSGYKHLIHEGTFTGEAPERKVHYREWDKHE